MARAARAPGPRRRALELARRGERAVRGARPRARAVRTLGAPGPAGRAPRRTARRSAPRRARAAVRRARRARSAARRRARARRGARGRAGERAPRAGVRRRRRAPVRQRRPAPDARAAAGLARLRGADRDPRPAHRAPRRSVARGRVLRGTRGGRSARAVGGAVDRALPARGGPGRRQRRAAAAAAAGRARAGRAVGGAGAARRRRRRPGARRARAGPVVRGRRALPAPRRLPAVRVDRRQRRGRGAPGLAGRRVGAPARPEPRRAVPAGRRAARARAVDRHRAARRRRVEAGRARGRVARRAAVRRIPSAGARDRRARALAALPRAARALARRRPRPAVPARDPRTRRTRLERANQSRNRARQPHRPAREFLTRMHLKRLELFGFKSFADRTVLEFQNGLTGIVGPNGCGKSNVVDAVRWVLGEQRPTSMRGTEMVDVIFKGSAARPALSVAEVTLVLDNDGGMLEGRGAEVSITRRVFRAGEGEYLIDGERVRLKDVRAMLYNTGLGSRGYSVLEQGKIDAVLSADPLERRGIFEEAAGVSRYRAQRKEVAARLQRVEQDMARLEDVIGELESRVRSLKIQAGKAERWSEARATWRTSAESLAKHQVWLCNQELARVARELSGSGESERELRALRTTAEEDHASREREMQALLGEIERGAADAAELAAELRALDERRANLSSRAASARAAAAEERTRAAELGGKLAEREREAASARGEHAELDERARVAQAEAARLAEELRELSKRSRLAREASQSANDHVLACLRERTAAQNGLEHLSASLAPLGERTQEAERREREARELLGAAQGDREGAGRSEGEALLRVERAERTRAEGEAEAAGLEQRRARLVHEKQELELERARAKSRIEALLDWQQERESLSAGAQALLSGELSAELGGLLADHLHTQTRHARALDAVLGDRAQSLVLRSAEQAGKLLEWLREHKAGQARLVAPAGLAGALDGAAAGPLHDAERALR
ncbi:MAG: hypothetical protein EPO68_00225, partial [Planctomycetota bacterium]